MVCRATIVLLTVFLSVFPSCGGGSGSGSGGGGNNNPTVPGSPSGLTATAGNLQVTLSWNASAGATSYRVKRSTTSGSGYAAIASPATTSYTDTGLTNGTVYYYVVTAVNAAGESANSPQASATPAAPATAVHVTVDVLSNRHAISPYVYGGSYPKDAATITDSGLTVVRWGGNATSRYNWKTFTYNAAADWYYEDYVHRAIGDTDSAQFIRDVKTAGSNPLITMVMLPWVAKPEGHWSFSVAKYGAQCKADPYNSDAGNGLKADCTTKLIADPTDANVQLLDTAGTNDPPGTVYRDEWAAALAAAFGSAPHFYDMDNEPDIWGGTHRDVHPDPAGYEELRDGDLKEARLLKGWDPLAIRFGPVSCCWWFYWNGAEPNDKSAHAGIDFLPWWLNEVYWRDQIAGTQSLEVFDIHAYPDAPDTANLTPAQKQALTARIYRDYWDPTYTSESGTINQTYTTQIQPLHAIPFRIPRMRALVNTIYPGVPLTITEWSAAFAGETDFSTALADADGYGILGRERVYLASRWGAPDPANPNYQALKLFTNYDGQHHSFAPISVAATGNGDSNLFSSYAAVNAAGTAMTLLFLNKDPQNAAQVQFSLTGFNASQVTSYTLAQTGPTQIVASATRAWNATQNFNPYSATLLVITGATTSLPATEWELNPDTIMVPANGTVTLSPRLLSSSGTVTLGTPQADSGITLTVTKASITQGENGSITVAAGATPGFYHYTLPGTDSTGVTQTQGGWVLVGNPAATLARTAGDAQTGPGGSTLPQALTVTMTAGQSGGSNNGASILFTTDGGSLSNGTSSGAKVIAVTNGSGVASVTLTLPAAAGTVHVTAEGPYGLGHPVVSFTATAN